MSNFDDRNPTFEGWNIMETSWIWFNLAPGPEASRGLLGRAPPAAAAPPRCRERRVGSAGRGRYRQDGNAQNALA